jgi:hypothetical protein
VIEEHQVRAGGGDYTLNLLQFALPHQGRRIGPWPSLDQRCGNLGPGAASQLFELGQRCFPIEIGDILSSSARPAAMAAAPRAMRAAELSFRFSPVNSTATSTARSG